MLTELKVVVPIGEDDAEPAWRGAGEGSTAAQNHLVFEEVSPEAHLFLKRGLRKVLATQRDGSATALREVRSEIPAAHTYLSEVGPDEHGRGPVQVWDVQTLQLSRHVAVGGF